MTSPYTFLFSSALDNPARFFQGYLFDGANYICGQAGYERYRDETGARAIDGEDGSYVHAELTQGGFRFSCDHHGYRKIFYFRDQAFWAVSNSLSRLASHLRENRIDLQPNRPQLAAASAEGTFFPTGRGSFFAQLTSFETIFKGVRLLPAGHDLTIGTGGAVLRHLPRMGDAQGYAESLADFAGLWKARMRTLSTHPSLQITCDLSGGIDSRSVYALLLSSGIIDHLSSDRRLRIQSNASALRDLKAAARITDCFGQTLNMRLKRQAAPLGGAEAYRLWRDLCLGTYFPIYLPHKHLSPFDVQFGGGGGENNRPFYGKFLGAPSADTFVARRSRNLSGVTERREFADALSDTMRVITAGRPTEDPLAIHYSQFRNRFHAGRPTQYRVVFHPLASRYLETCLRAAGNQRFQDGQVLFDILYHADPQLLDLPFDTRRKAPGSRVRRSLTRIEGCEHAPGRCYIGIEAPTETARDESSDALDLMRGDFEAASHGFAGDFLGSAYVARARAALDQAQQTGSFGGTIRSKRVGVVLACGQF